MLAYGEVPVFGPADSCVRRACRRTALPLIRVGNVRQCLKGMPSAVRRLAFSCVSAAGLPNMFLQTRALERRRVRLFCLLSFGAFGRPSACLIALYD